MLSTKKVILIVSTVPAITTPIPFLDTLAQLIGKALGCKDAGVFWTSGKEWSHMDSWCWAYSDRQGQQVKNYELRLWGLEVSFCR